MGTIIDSAACAITKDTAGQACVWCEGISKFLGTGMCLSPSQKDMVGQFWDMLCGTSSRSNQLEDRTKTNLRGAEMKLRDWKQLDPTCLGSTSGLNTSKNCGTSLVFLECASRLYRRVSSPITLIAKTK